MLTKPREALIHKLDVARSFGLAAPSYDDAAELQRRAGERLLTYLPKTDGYRMLDLGSGTGHFTRKLARLFPAMETHSLDLAEGMTRYARGQDNRLQALYACGDAEQLPFRSATFSLIFSNLALQWCSDFQACLTEAYRALTEEGCLLASTLGPKTLHELKYAWRQVDDYVHVNRFLDENTIREQAESAGFSCQLSESKIIMHYDNLRELTQALKAIGAHNINSGRPDGLTGRHKVRRLLAEYENFRDKQGCLPATYQVYYLCLTKI